MFDIGLSHYLILSALLFSLGVLGMITGRKSVLSLLMAIELLLLAVNINMVAFSVFLNDLAGQVFTLFILTVAAAEAAIGLAILVVYYRQKRTVAIEDISSLRG